MTLHSRRGQSDLFTYGRATFTRYVPGMFFLAAMLSLAGCRSHEFPDYPANYREYAYVTNGGSNTVTVLDVVNLRQDRVIRVGADPTGAAVNSKRNEVYVANTGSNSV